MASAFLPSTPTMGRLSTKAFAGFSEDYGWGTDVVRRKERDARMAGQGDRVVEVLKPLGVVLEEDKKGDVFVAEVTPGGNGAKSGLKVTLTKFRGYLSWSPGPPPWGSITARRFPISGGRKN